MVINIQEKRRCKTCRFAIRINSVVWKDPLLCVGFSDLAALSLEQDDAWNNLCIVGEANGEGCPNWEVV